MRVQLAEVDVTGPVVRANPRLYPPIAGANVMRMTAIQAQTERTRQDRSAGCAEKHYRRDRTRRLRGLIRPVPAARPTAEATLQVERLAQQTDSGDFYVSRHATWGMSAGVRE